MTEKTKAFVHIVESPSPKDLLEGQMEGKALCEAMALAEIPHNYCLATTPETFKEALCNKIIGGIEHHKSLPILHLSMHGNNEGVALTNNHFITWDELRHELTPLKNYMNGGLLICMSSCFGSAGFRIEQHINSDSPFWALVGNVEAATWSDSAIAYIAFYHNFFKGKSIEECVNIMKIASGNDLFIYHSGHEVKLNWQTHIAELLNELDTTAFRSGLLGLGASASVDR